MAPQTRRRTGPSGWLLAMAIALPAAAAEGDAFARVCREKLRVLYKATMRFAADHDGYLPPAWMSPDLGEPIPGRGIWSLYLKPYFDEMGERTDCGFRRNRRQPAAAVTHCPANPYWYGGNGPNCLGYAWNSNLGSRAVRDGKASGPPPVRFQDVLNKSRTILIVDAACVPQRPPYCFYRASHPREAGPWHDGKAHVLFVDGHIEALAPADIQASWFSVKIKATGGDQASR